MTTLSSFCRFLLNSTTLSNPTKSTGFSVTNFPSDTSRCTDGCRLLRLKQNVLQHALNTNVSTYDCEISQHVCYNHYENGSMEIVASPDLYQEQSTALNNNILTVINNPTLFTAEDIQLSRVWLPTRPRLPLCDVSIRANSE